MKKVAITGGIGSGKSTVAAYIRELGYSVFSCDDIYREILKSSMYIKKIEELFPKCVISGKIDKSMLAEIVFADNEKRKKLEEMAHPMIMECLLARMNACEGEYVFAEVPLLFEGNFIASFDKIIVVTRKLEDRISALLERDNCSRAQIDKKISAQFDYDSDEGKIYLKQHSIIEVSNNQSISDLKAEIYNALKFL